MLAEHFECVGFKHFGPQVGVIASGISVAAEDVVEIGATVAELYFAWQSYAAGNRLLKFHYVDVAKAVVDFVPFEVEQRCPDRSGNRSTTNPND